MEDKTRSKTIRGVRIEFPVVFHKGHVCNRAEAMALQQTWMQNIGSKTRQYIKEAQDPSHPMTMDEAVELVKDYAKDYKFSVGVDALTREMKLIADAKLKYLVAKKGKSKKDYSAEQWQRNIDVLMKSDEVRKRAEENLARGYEIEEEINGLDI